MSRVRDEIARRQANISGDWRVDFSCPSEEKAHKEMAWWSKYSNYREYKLVKLSTTKDLDDELPF